NKRNYMDIEAFRDYCLQLKGVTEELPFGPDNLVFKVQGKMFALASLDEIPLRVNLKCDPEEAINLRDQYPDNILPGYHMSKKHWNTVILDGMMTQSMIYSLTDNSYDRAAQGLPKRLQKELEDL